ncbi:MAG: hypothetical protein CMJ20_13175 [Phycisphaeraceae bacterium]|nr:hypothetical protein [Phycisphaeraceae bacterium]
MDQRAITRSGVKVSPVGLGCVTFGREIDQETSFKLLDHALDKGINLLDTAESYGGGQAREARAKQCGFEDNREVTTEISSSEKIIGRWLKARGVRDEVVICTKVWTTGGGGMWATDITRSLEESLERMGIDHADIFMMHMPDTKVPIDQTLGELKELFDRGLARTIGASNYTADQIHEALGVSENHGWPPFESIQPKYNLIEREAEDQLLGLCAQKKIGVMAYSPLCQGFLSGKYTSDPASIPKGSRFDIKPTHGPRYFTDKNFRILEKLRQQASELGVPIVRLAVAWVMTHPAVTSTLIGARTCEHIDNGIAALDLVLDPDLRETMSSWK